MPQALVENYDFKELAANLVKEDDEPADKLFSERQQRLLVESLYALWKPLTTIPANRVNFMLTQTSAFFSRFTSRRLCRTFL